MPCYVSHTLSIENPLQAIRAALNAMISSPSRVRKVWTHLQKGRVATSNAPQLELQKQMHGPPICSAPVARLFHTIASLNPVSGYPVLLSPQAVQPRSDWCEALPARVKNTYNTVRLQSQSLTNANKCKTYANIYMI